MCQSNNQFVSLDLCSSHVRVSPQCLKILFLFTGESELSRCQQGVVFETLLLETAEINGELGNGNWFFDTF